MLSLYPINENHSTFIINLAKDERNAEFFRNFSPASMWPENASSLFKAGYVIADNDKYLGLISICNIDSVVGQLEFGVVISNSVLDKRDTMSQALHQLAQYCFNCLGFNKMYAKVLEHRTSLIQLMFSEKFVQDGILRQNVRFNGKLANEVVLSLLKVDYNTVSPSLSVIKEKQYA